MLGASFEQPWCRDLWLAFVSSLSGDPERLTKLSKIIDSSIKYFAQIEGAFSSLQEISGESLHREIESETHRKHLLAYRFLTETHGLKETAEARDSANEDRRLSIILERGASLPSSELLIGYVKSLQAESLAQKTVRLYAGVAQRFCESANADSAQGWPRDAVEQYLQSTPGAANSLSKFVMYCRSEYGWEHSMPSKGAIRNSPGYEKRSVERMRRVLSQVQGKPAQQLKLMEVSRIIAAATGLPLRQLVGAQSVELSEQDPRTIVLAKDALIAPGHPLHPFVARWSALIAMRTAVKAGVSEE